MAKQTINIGTTANDGTGSSLRVAGDMINDNFTELYDILSIGLFAALSAAESTDTTNDWTPILGTFTNDPNVGFSFVADPAIQYDGTKTLYFKIDCHASLSCQDNNSTVYGAIKKNGQIVNESIMSLFAKTATELYTFSGTCVIELEEGDKIQLVVRSEGDTRVTFENITAAIKPFIL